MSHRLLLSLPKTSWLRFDSLGMEYSVQLINKLRKGRRGVGPLQGGEMGEWRQVLTVIVNQRITTRDSISHMDHNGHMPCPQTPCRASSHNAVQTVL